MFRIAKSPTRFCVRTLNSEFCFCAVCELYAPPLCVARRQAPSAHATAASTAGNDHENDDEDDDDDDDAPLSASSSSAASKASPEVGDPEVVRRIEQIIAGGDQNKLSLRSIFKKLHKSSGIKVGKKQQPAWQSVVLRIMAEIGAKPDDDADGGRKKKSKKDKKDKKRKSSSGDQSDSDADGGGDASDGEDKKKKKKDKKKKKKEKEEKRHKKGKRGSDATSGDGDEPEEEEEEQDEEADDDDEQQQDHSDSDAGGVGSDDEDDDGAGRPSAKKKQRRAAVDRDEEYPGMPKRPLTAFFAFNNEVREQLKRDQPDMKFTDMSKEGGARWKALRYGVCRVRVKHC